MINTRSRAVNQQPQYPAPISCDNQITRGLVHSWGLNVLDWLSAYDSAGNAHGVFGNGIPATTHGNQWKLGPEGWYINFDDSGTGTTTSKHLRLGSSSGSGSPGSQAFSILARINYASLISTPTIYGCTGGGIQFRIAWSGELELLCSQVVSLGTSTGKVQTNTDINVAVTFDGNELSFYINGIPSGTVIRPYSGFDLSQQYYLGSRGIQDEMVENLSRIYRLDIWNRSLSSAEVKAWSDNPWQIYKNRSAVLASPVAVGSKMTPALYVNAQGQIVQSPGGLGNVRPLVLYQGQMRIRLASEGIPLVLDQGKLRTLASDETLLI